MIFTIATVNELLFPVILFFGFFCVCCNLLSSAKHKAAPIPNPTAQIKEAFSDSFNPEPVEASNLSVEPKLLPPTRERRRNCTQTPVNPVLITPLSTTHEEEKALPPLPQKPTLRALRDYVRNHNLQKLVKERTGQSVSQCRQFELIKALQG